MSKCLYDKSEKEIFNCQLYGFGDASSKAIEIVGLECVVYCSRMNSLVNKWRDNMADMCGQEVNARSSVPFANYSILPLDNQLKDVKIL